MQVSGELAEPESATPGVCMIHVLTNQASLLCLWLSKLLTNISVYFLCQVPECSFNLGRCGDRCSEGDRVPGPDIRKGHTGGRAVADGGRGAAAGRRGGAGVGPKACIRGSREHAGVDKGGEGRLRRGRDPCQFQPAPGEPQAAWPVRLTRTAKQAENG